MKKIAFTIVLSLFTPLFALGEEIALLGLISDELLLNCCPSGICTSNPTDESNLAQRIEELQKEGKKIKSCEDLRNTHSNLIGREEFKK